MASKSTSKTTVRTARVRDDAWNRAQRRSKSDGVTMSQVVNRLVVGYGEGKIELPRVQMVYGHDGDDTEQ